MTQSSPATIPGTLYVVATPIGNLHDISLRAIDVLRNQVAYIACEDTRQSRILLQHHVINTATVALHQHNEKKCAARLMEDLQQGKSVALISDAGTPGISDPGTYLINLAHQHHIKVVPIAGPCAAIAALSASGIDSNQFLFIGFLASKGQRRQQQLAAWLSYPFTLIFYESPHRIINFLQLYLSIDKSARKIVLAREISKRFETILYGEAQHILKTLQDNPVQRKGEFVVIIEPNDVTPQVVAQTSTQPPKQGHTNEYEYKQEQKQEQEQQQQDQPDSIQMPRPSQHSTLGQHSTAAETTQKLEQKNHIALTNKTFYRSSQHYTPPTLSQHSTEKNIEETLNILLTSGISQSMAVKICCQLCKVKKNAVYSLALKISGNNSAQ